MKTEYARLLVDMWPRHMFHCGGVAYAVRCRILGYGYNIDFDDIHAIY